MRLGRGGCRSKGVRAGRVCADSRCPCLRRRTAGRSTASPAGLGRKRGPCGGGTYNMQRPYWSSGGRSYTRPSNDI